MRLIVAVLANVYLLGVGAALAPTVRGEWRNGSDLAVNLKQALPNALAWPATLFRYFAPHR